MSKQERKSVAIFQVFKIKKYIIKIFTNQLEKFDLPIRAILKKQLLRLNYFCPMRSARVLQSGTISLSFFTQKLCSQNCQLGMVNLSSVHNQFKFPDISGMLGLQLMNTLGTAKVLGSNLTGPVFFFKRKIFR